MGSNMSLASMMPAMAANVRGYLCLLLFCLLIWFPSELEHGRDVAVYADDDPKQYYGCQLGR